MKFGCAASLLFASIIGGAHGSGSSPVRFLQETANEKLMKCLDSHPPEQFQQCLKHHGVTVTENDGRRLQNDETTQPIDHLSDARNFVDPCASLPDNPAAGGWTRLRDNDDLSSAPVSLSFDFSLYGTLYPKNTALVYVNNNGNISFNSSIAEYTANGFPLANVAMVAPFWSDVDTRGPGNGKVWYKEIGDKTFSVVWDRVGYYNENTEKRNTFQVVISDGTNAKFNGLGNNVCFCYGDMDWSTGSASGGVDGFDGVPATAGINRGISDNYVQMGRFGVPGSAYDGPGNATDGVDWLDYQGYIHPGDGSEISAVCFDARFNNIAPVVTGFPTEDTAVGTTCSDIGLEFSLTFATPEIDQSILLTLPTDLPKGMNLTMTESNNRGSIQVEITWFPSTGQEGNYELHFVAADDFIVPAIVEKTLSIQVVRGTCGAQDPEDLPTMCIQVNETTCEGDPKPYCTPYRSPDHCPASSSFPLLVGDREKLVKGYVEAITNGGTPDLDEHWFQYLEDKGAAYVFSRGENVPTPDIYCCIDDVDQLQMCFGNAGSGAPSQNFVIRASGLHSSMGKYVMPGGFGTTELLTGRTLSIDDIKTEIIEKYPFADKIIVEEFISGAAPDMPPKLPTEYKFHMFNGKFGSVSAFYNRGTDCECYLEVDDQWNRLDQYGCFVPSMPMGKNDNGDRCWDINFDLGYLNPFPFKGFDICGVTEQPNPCAWNYMLQKATDLSVKIGVYMRIDFFVTDDNRIYVQEYTRTHNGGLRHCAAKTKNDGCIDSCFLGEMWKNAGGNIMYGGPVLTRPSSLDSYSMSSAEDQCDVVDSTAIVNPAQACLPGR